MPSTVEQLSPSRAKITVEVPFAELKPHLDKAYKEIAQQVQIPGFRPGHIPAAIIDQRFGPGVALEQALNEALPGLYSSAVDEHGLVPLTQPEIEVTKLEVGESVEFTAEVDVRPDFMIPAFDGIEVEVDAVESTEDELEEQVKILRERFATNTEVDRAAKEGDLVTFDLKATKDDELVEGGEAEGVTYRVGAGGMVEGMDEALTGMKAGETKSFTSTLVGGPAAGQEADIEVTVTKVQEQELPEVDDDFAQMVSEFDTADEMYDDLRENLARMHRVDQANTARDKVLEAVIGQIDMELPENLLASEISARNNQVDQELAQAGMTLKQYLADSDETEESEEEFRANLAQRSAEAVKAQLVLDRIAEDQDLQIEQTDLTEHLFARARANRTSPEQEMQHMLEHDHTNEWMTEIRRAKALALIVQSATVKDTEGNVIDLKNLQADGTYAEPAEAEGDTDVAEESADEAPAKKAAAKKAPAKKAAEKDADDTEVRVDDQAADEAKSVEADAE
ncbi:trigger factor [Raineyella antarctica]|uniref:Trigger factor n=1 Tax=Raineyella antarctica TaxID=1577474 RepID=A0A1G6H284_9ACTN|nr:trigger factor [Raineyella antarctica]SDB88228.1 trigger factor [Raineyella antarctica]